MDLSNAPTREIADHVSKSSGQMFTTTDIRNRINKYNSEIHGDENDIDDFLMTLSKMVAMLLPNMTRTREFEFCWFKLMFNLMFKALSEARPNPFFTDTTFGTNKEEYKLHLPTYVSVVTGETEVKK